MYKNIILIIRIFSYKCTKFFFYCIVVISKHLFNC